MAQTTRPAPKPEPTPTPAPVHPSPPPAGTVMPQRPMAMPPLVNDRMLLEQLRQIYQASMRHLPVPVSTVLNKDLETALEQIEKISEKAVTDYKPD